MWCASMALRIFRSRRPISRGLSAMAASHAALWRYLSRRCIANAPVRSGLWQGQAAPDLPSMGDILQAQTAARAEPSERVDSARYEKDWQARVTKSLW